MALSVWSMMALRQQTGCSLSSPPTDRCALFPAGMRLVAYSGGSRAGGNEKLWGYAGGSVCVVPLRRVGPGRLMVLFRGLTESPCFSSKIQVLSLAIRGVARAEKMGVMTNQLAIMVTCMLHGIGTLLPTGMARMRTALMMMIISVPFDVQARSTCNAPSTEKKCQHDNEESVVLSLDVPWLMVGQFCARRQEMCAVHNGPLP